MLEMTTDTAHADRARARERRKDLIQKFAALGSLVMLVVVFSATSNAFMSLGNGMTVALQVAPSITETSMAAPNRCQK